MQRKDNKILLKPNKQPTVIVLIDYLVGVSDSEVPPANLPCVQ